jgi:nitrogen fixation/metabolism regulation signal transduction histidine kinase
MSTKVLKRRVQARDRLLMQAESVGQLFDEQMLAAIARGDLSQVEAAVRRHDARLSELTEDLRIYQAELHAQADELLASQVRTEAMVQRFAALFAGMLVACVIVTFNGRLLECNGLASSLLSLPKRTANVTFLHRLVDSASLVQRGMSLEPGARFH